MKIVIFVLLLLSGMAHASDCEFKKEFDQSQWALIEQAYNIGLPHDYGNTLAAIIIQESRAGKFRVNPDSRDFGVTQMNIKTLVARMGLENTSWNRSVAASRIVQDDDLALALGLEEILYWDRVRKGNWRQVISSYNAGWNYANAGDYWMLIGANIKKLKGCFNVQEQE